MGLQIPLGMDGEVSILGSIGGVGLCCRELPRDIAMSKEVILPKPDDDFHVV